MNALLFKLTGNLLLPLLLFGLIFWGGYQVGASDVRSDWNDEKLKTQAIFAKALEKNIDLTAKAETASRQIELINREHNEQINHIRSLAADDLAKRMRRDSGKTCRNNVPKNSDAAYFIPKTKPSRTILFPESVAKRLEQRHQYADEITESLRACRSYVQSLEDYRK